MVRLTKTLAIGIALLVLGGRAGSGAVLFSDVPQDAWYLEHLDRLTTLGGLAGFPSGSSKPQFQPTTLITRAEFLKLCLHSVRSALTNSSPSFPVPDEPPFEDVPVKAWFSGYVDFAKRMEVIDTGALLFSPDAPITRLEAVKIIVRSLEIEGGVRHIRPPRDFPDTENVDVDTAYRGKIVEGSPDGLFLPSRLLNRAEAIAFISRAVVNLEEYSSVRLWLAAYTPKSPPLQEKGRACSCSRVGIRLNLPDSPSDNFIRISIDNSYVSDGVYYTLRRDNKNIRVWPSLGKTLNPLLGNNDLVVLPSGPEGIRWIYDVYVENASFGQSVLSLELRRSSDDSVIASKKVNFQTFDRMAVVLSGKIWSDSTETVPGPDESIGNVARLLYERGYDVFLYNEERVAEDGSGIVFDKIHEAIRERDVKYLSLIGFSRGGGAVFSLSKRLEDDQSLPSYSLFFTAYVDAITSRGAGPEKTRPRLSDFHANYYEWTDFLLPGAETIDADVNCNVNDTAWGESLRHAGSIAESPEVWNRIISEFEASVDNLRRAGCEGALFGFPCGC